MKRIISLTLVLLMMNTFVPVLKAEETAKITGISIDGQDQGLNAEKKISKSGGTLNVIVLSENLDDLKCLLDYGNGTKSVESYGVDVLSYSKRKFKSGFMLTIDFPANVGEEDKEYLFRFKATTFNDASLKVIVSGKEDSGEPSPEPNPSPNPEPKPGEDTNKAQILGLDMGDEKLVKTFTDGIKKEGKSYKFKVKTKNVDTIKTYSIMEYNGSKRFNPADITLNVGGILNNEAEVELIVSANKADSCKKYEIFIGYDGGINSYNDGVKLSIEIDGTKNMCGADPGNTEDPIERVATISRISDTEDIKDDVLKMEIDSKEQDKKVYLTLINGDILKDGELDAIVKKDGVIDNSIKAVFTGEKNSRIANISFTENNTDKDITYEVTFRIKNKIQKK